MMTPQACRAMSSLKLLMPLGIVACSAPRRSLPASSAPLVVVSAPVATPGDDPANLVNGTLEPYGWHCAEGSPPLTYEFMFADDLAREVRAVGMVLGNTGPQGVGDVDVRVQHGHGSVGPGETFRATLVGRGDHLRWIQLPHGVRGDHVVITFPSRSPSMTALCLGEVVVPDERTPIEPRAAVAAQALDLSPDASVVDATPQ